MKRWLVRVLLAWISAAAGRATLKLEDPVPLRRLAESMTFTPR